MSGKILVVGESNPYGSDPAFALYPSPEGSAGHRLCVMILGMKRGEYLRDLDRANLLAGGRWSAPAARLEAERLLEGRDRLLLLGRRVAAAFGAATGPFSVVRRGGALLGLIPHPSGRCREWNDPSSFDRARIVFRCLREGREA